MATKTVHFVAYPDQTLTATVWPRRADSAASASGKSCATLTINPRPGTYKFDVTEALVGEFDVTVVDADSNLAFDGRVTFPHDDSDYVTQAYSKDSMSCASPTTPTAIPTVNTATALEWHMYFVAWCLYEIVSDASSIILKDQDDAAFVEHAHSDDGTTYTQEAAAAP